MKLYLRVADDAVISDAGFEGSGCAISVASASLPEPVIPTLGCNECHHRSADQQTAVVGYSTVDTLIRVAETLLEKNGPDTGLAEPVRPEFEKIRALDGVREFPSRIKCATLAWHALHSAIHEQSTPVSTE